MRPLVLLLAISISSATHAAESLAEVTSEVYQADGMTKDQITSKAMQCIKSSGGNAAKSIEPAVDGDNAYAIVKTAYSHALVAGTVRSRITVQAKDGRFRVVHTDIDNFNDFAKNYIPIYKSWGTGWQKAEAALQGWFPDVSACILKKTEEKTDESW